MLTPIGLLLRLTVVGAIVGAAAILSVARGQQWSPQWGLPPGVQEPAFVPYTIDERTHNAIINHLEELRMTARERDPLIGLLRQLEAQAQQQAAIERAKRGQSAPPPPAPGDGGPKP